MNDGRRSPRTLSTPDRGPRSRPRTPRRTRTGARTSPAAPAADGGPTGRRLWDDLGAAVGKAVVGGDEPLRLVPSRCSPTATSSSRTSRAPARRCSPGRSPGPSTSGRPASRARRTCCRSTSPAPACSRAAGSASSPGPVFTNVLLVDEINRATPRTQSALLEAMQEHQVSIEGTTRPLPEPFVVLATQNPIEFEGTFALPQAQLDRFLVRVRLGYPDEDGERRIARRYQDAAEPLDAIEPVADGAAILALRDEVRPVRSPTRSRPTSSRSSGRPGRTRTSQLGREPAGDGRAVPRGAGRGGPRGPRRSSCRTTSRRSPRPVLAHRLVVDLDRSLRGATAESALAAILASMPAPPLAPPAAPRPDDRGLDRRTTGCRRPRPPPRPRLIADERARPRGGPPRPRRRVRRRPDRDRPRDRHPPARGVRAVWARVRAARRALHADARRRPDDVGRRDPDDDRGLEPEAPAARLAAGPTTTRRPGSSSASASSSIGEPGHRRPAQRLDARAVRARHPPLPRRRRAARRLTTSGPSTSPSATCSRAQAAVERARRPRTGSSSGRGRSRRPASSGPTGGAASTRPKAGLAEDPSRFAGVRPYAPGDPLRRIHARASARLGQPITKRFEPSRDREVLIALDVQTADGPAWEVAFDDDDVESLYVVAASLARALAGGAGGVRARRGRLHGRRDAVRERPGLVVGAGPGRAGARPARPAVRPRVGAVRAAARARPPDRPAGDDGPRPDRPRPDAVRAALRRLEAGGCRVVVIACGRDAVGDAARARSAGFSARPARLDGPWQTASALEVAS